MEKPKAPVALPEHLGNRLFVYAMAAGASLAAAQPAAATVIYTNANELLTDDHILALDLNHDTITDFNVVNSRSSVFSDRNLLVNGIASLNGIAASAGNRNAVLLPEKVIVGSSRNFQRTRVYMASVTSGAKAYGPWVNQTGYLGLRFTIDSQTHYGWAHFAVTPGPGQTISTTLINYAYETVANTPILTGTPEPGTLGLLAAGALGLAAWRRRKQARG